VQSSDTDEEQITLGLDWNQVIVEDDLSSDELAQPSIPVLEGKASIPTTTTIATEQPSTAKKPFAPAPVLPKKVGAMILESLGEIIPDPGYHTKTHIFPIGYQISRMYNSMFYV
jgi:hypothetical protein